MSDPQNFSTPAETPTREETAETGKPVTEQPETTAQETSTTEQTPAANETAMSETNGETSAAAPATEKDDVPTQKSIEPISEGQLSYKGPGLLKSLIPSKKEFWLSDEAVPPQELNTYMRGEKQDIADPVVAWASQTGKGLLFFNKKGDTTRKQPGGVFGMYDATDLRKQHPHEILFKLNGHEHTLKAASDAERDGWYMSLEKSVELGKASKEQIRGSEGYKAEMERLNKPNVPGVGAAGAAKKAPHHSQPPKAADEHAAEPTDAAKRAGSDTEEDVKQKKSRSTSRGILNRLKSKKDDVEEKREEKKEEKVAEKEEKKAEKEEPKSDDKEKEAGEAAAVGAGVAAGGAALDAHNTADRAVDAPVEESKEPATETSAASETPSEKPKPSKRGSIFGKMQAGWGSMKSPSKEKDQKEAELKPEVPPKDNVVSDSPPQLPETATASQPTEAAAAPVMDAGEAGKAEVEAKAEPKTEAAKEATASPSTEKKSFLSSFMNKRNRSVSPSAAMKEAPAQKDDAAPSVPPKEDAPEPVAAPEEPVAESAPAPTATDATEKTEEPAKTETPAAKKRESMLGSLGRRASKAFNRMGTPKKENVAPSSSESKPAEPKSESATEPTTNGESKVESAEAPQQQQPLSDTTAAAPELSSSQPEQTPTVTASA